MSTRQKWLLGFLLVISASAAFPQSSAPLFSGNVTESELVHALMLEPDAKTRGIKPSSSVSTPRKPPSASLLITFVTNSAVLTGQAKSSLDVVARALKDGRLNDFRFAIEGHADPRGSSQHNLQLSKERADAVSNYLVTAHGIPKSRLHAEGKGDRELMNLQNIASPENRRVTLINLGEAR